MMNYLERKKLALMRGSTFKGYLKNVSGYPVVLSDVYNTTPKSLCVYGNSYQATDETSPSPDFPSEIQCVGDLTTKNLFDLSSSGGFVSDYAGVSCDINGDVSCDINGDVATVNYTGSSGRTFYMNLGTFETGTYYFGADVKDIESVTNGKFHIRKVDDNSILNSINNVVTLTEPTEIKFYGAFNTGGTVEISNIQITKSDVPTEYEPYHKYKIPFTVSGKNLLCNNNRTEVKPEFSSEALKQNFNNNIIIGIAMNGYTSSGSIKEYTFTETGLTLKATSGYGIGFDFDVVAGETYSVKCNADDPSNSIIAFSYYDADGNYVGKDGGGVCVFKTITIPKDVAKMVLIIRPYTSGTAITVSDIMFIKGTYSATTMPKYEPYHEPKTYNIFLDEPLRKVGDYADYIDLKSRKVVRNIFKQSLYAHSIYKKLTNVVRIDGCKIGSIKAKSDTHILSPMFKYEYLWVKDIEIIFHHHTTGFNYYWSVFWSRLGLTYDGTDVYKTDDSSKTPLTNAEIISIANDWLSTLSDEDKETHMILDTPTETSVTIPTIKLNRGTNILSVDTTISPSTITCEYFVKDCM